MTYSLNEIEAMAKRAARGAGYHWGHAEEAGKAARWLAEYDLPGPELLAQLLTLNFGRSYACAAPRSAAGPWRAGEGDLCPLLAGSALCDRATELANGRVFDLEAVAYPLLLVPLAASASGLTGYATALDWDGIAIHVAPQGIAIGGNQDALMASRTGHLTCRISRVADHAVSLKKFGRAVDAKHWTVLGELARRTFAPATEASRLAGAGAGLTDND